jgi:hypothetical protein
VLYPTAGKLILVLFVYRGSSDEFYDRLDRAVVARYFAFLSISQLIIFTLIGVGFSQKLFLPSIAL